MRRSATAKSPTGLSSYRRALWNRQEVYVKIWSEKDAISEIIAPGTREWAVRLRVARGFSSETFLWNTAATINAVGSHG